MVRWLSEERSDESKPEWLGFDSLRSAQPGKGHSGDSVR
jgi:hypothetical protein